MKPVKLRGARGQRQRAVYSHLEESLSSVPEPPVKKGVNATEVWAAALNLRAAMQAEREQEPELVKALVSICRHLGQLKCKAARSELALENRKAHFGDRRTLGEKPPLDDPILIVLWAYFELAREAHLLATGKKQVKESSLKVRILAQQGFLPCNHLLDELSDEIDRKEYD